MAVLVRGKGQVPGRLRGLPGSQMGQPDVPVFAAQYDRRPAGHHEFVGVTRKQAGDGFTPARGLVRGQRAGKERMAEQHRGRGENGNTRGPARQAGERAGARDDAVGSGRVPRGDLVQFGGSAEGIVSEGQVGRLPRQSGQFATADQASPCADGVIGEAAGVGRRIRTHQR